MCVYSFSPFGYEGSLVTVEVDLRRGIPAVDIVGLADGAVKESRERMRSAIINSGYDFPCERVLISLSPSDLKKEGAGFDLPLALAVLIKSRQGEFNFLNEKILIMGELELNGKLRPVRAVHAAAATAFAAGIGMCIVPAENAEEAREAGSMKVFGASNLTEAFEALSCSKMFTGKSRDYLNDKKAGIPQGAVEKHGILFAPVEEGYEYSEVKNQKKLVRALQVAAAGGHNLLAYGSPGCGKTLSLQKFPALLPLLTAEESSSVTRIHSIAGLLAKGSSIIRKPVFRQPHQTASIEGICGGGCQCRPGEISLAHNGVLFLDEAAEFRSSVLQMLRVPLESRSITISRAGRSTIFPASFQLLMSANPCPCGNYGSKDKICLCSSRSVEQYWKKFSAPLLDRIDIRIRVDSSPSADNMEEKAMTTDQLREDIGKAVALQRKRQGKKNALLSPEETARYCITSSDAKKVLDKASEKYEFSPRAASGCLKLARTIADMKEKDIIDGEAMTEAVSLRKNENTISLML
ncbi:MAG: YifB family Mg chelatase-like AAA ATPase [Treponema sp.]|nr:YifB family Mg chelatase-like AAA ATPase [Treponema sp.]